MRSIPLEPIRRAVGSGEFEKAHRLWEECARHIAAGLDEGTLSGEEIREVLELVEWTRLAVLCARNHTMQQLSALRVAGEYDGAAPVYGCVSASF